MALLQKPLVYNVAASRFTYSIDNNNTFNLNFKMLPSAHLMKLIRLWQHVEADLGMFSMFGQTGAPTKRTKKIVHYAYKYYSNTPSLAYSLLQKGWPQTASQLLLQ